MTAPSGKAAVDRANGWSSYESGMCLKWVRGPCWDIGSYFGSAIEAWNGARYKHPGDRSAPVGAPLFYKGGSYGHVVICKPNDEGMRSTDCTTTGDVSDAAITWVEKHWGYTYLGWIEDLNGVRLPLDLEGDDMPYRDWPQADKDALLADVATAVWGKLLKGMPDAPDGRKAGPTLSNIHSMLHDGHV